MQEAWFRIKGIPMKFRNKSTVFYAASLVGKSLALDKNYLRHFAFVRVKIGSQDLALVPNSRIGEIKKGFYEFQYSKELFDLFANAGNKSVIPVDTQGNEGNQGTPKRQRVGLQESDAGSQSAPLRSLETTMVLIDKMLCILLLWLGTKKLVKGNYLKWILPAI
jgi:hypothetical protein